MPDQGSRSTAGLLQLPCRALGSLADDESHRKRVRNGPPSNGTDERFVVVNDRQADGVQVGHRRIKNLATAERHKSLAEDCRRCQIQRRHRGPRSAGKPRRLIAPRHLKSLIAPPRAAEDSAGDELGRDASPAGRRLEPQGPRGAQSQLWWWPARQRGGPVEGQAYRQGAKDYSHRAVQGPQGSARNAVAQDARSVATVVEGAPNALGRGRAAGAALVVS